MTNLSCPKCSELTKKRVIKLGKLLLRSVSFQLDY